MFDHTRIYMPKREMQRSIHKSTQPYFGCFDISNILITQIAI